MKDRQRIIVIAFTTVTIVIVAIIAVWYVNETYSPAAINNRKQIQMEINEGGYQVGDIIRRESKKENTSNNDYELTKSNAIAQVQSGEYGKAAEGIILYFEIYKQDTPEGLDLKAYEEDIAIMNMFSRADNDKHIELLKSFKRPETILTLMVYLPARAKLGAFLSADSLVPTTENTNLQINKIEDAPANILATINNNYNNQYVNAKIAMFKLDGIEYTAYLMESQDGYIHVHSIETNDENCNFNTVEVWQSLILNY